MVKKKFIAYTLGSLILIILIIIYITINIKSKSYFSPINLSTESSDRVFTRTNRFQYIDLSDPNQFGLLDMLTKNIHIFNDKYELIKSNNILSNYQDFELSDIDFINGQYYLLMNNIDEVQKKSILLHGKFYEEIYEISDVIDLPIIENNKNNTFSFIIEKDNWDITEYGSMAILNSQVYPFDKLQDLSKEVESFFNNSTNAKLFPLEDTSPQLFESNNTFYRFDDNNDKIHLFSKSGDEFDLPKSSKLIKDYGTPSGYYSSSNGVVLIFRHNDSGLRSIKLIFLQNNDVNYSEDPITLHAGEFLGVFERNSRLYYIKRTDEGISFINFDN